MGAQTTPEARFVASQLAKAGTQLEAGKTKASLETLWRTEATVRSGDYPDETERMLALVAGVSEADARGSLAGECEALVERLHDILDRSRAPEYFENALGAVSQCCVISSAGLPTSASSERWYTVVFRPDVILFVSGGSPENPESFSLPWTDVSLDIEGAGAVSTGGGFFGGGFGLVGMATGALTAAALNALTTRTGIETILHFQSPSAELYLYHGDTLPDVLRRELAPVFLRLRQEQPARSAADGADMIARLHDLADLLDRGLIDADEFAMLKARLVAELSGS